MKTVVYLLPGTMCNELLWQDLKHLISEEITLKHIALPSAKTLDDITNALLNILPNNKVYLIGFSLGGYIASNFAANYPHRVQKLFIISNTACALNTNEINQRKELLASLKRFGYSGISRKRAMNLLDDDHKDERLINTIIEMDKQLGASVFLSQIEATTKRFDLSQKLINTKLSMTFYYSELDSFINTKWIAELSNNNEDLKMIVQSGKGHMLPLEQPVLLKSYIETWLQE
ncbi:MULTISPECIES: alpha/beta fold hydrolase [unclassified Pseudoalteromonas]|uniref:alpha/beta fold hydrolase n=1 Tax=unclassified Pseudoalteromonas TaxID=194690 RepID=UPI0005A8012B|nr:MULTISPECIES: alpha/beta hydrolase [unclassified Pseudoalteromonas]